jgi:hypothetical protein
LSIFSATVQVNLDKKMSAELVRSTKKNPPSKMKFELIYVRMLLIPNRHLPMVYCIRHRRMSMIRV